SCHQAGIACCCGTKERVRRSARQLFPSNSPSTTPRQYSSSCAGGSFRNSTRNASSVDSLRALISPNERESDMPVTACPVGEGIAHKGPKRGTKKNSSSIMGKLCNIRLALTRPCCQAGACCKG